MSAQHTQAQFAMICHAASAGQCYRVTDRTILPLRYYSPNATVSQRKSARLGLI